MTIFEHPSWPVILANLYIARGRDGINGPRHRLQIRKEAPVSVLDITVDCAHCGRPMHPVRQTKWSSCLSFNCSCPLAINIPCARSKETRAMANKVRAAIEARDTGTRGPGGIPELDLRR